MTMMLETPDFATDEIEVSIQLKRVAAFCDWVTSEHWATQTQRQGKEADATVS